MAWTERTKPTDTATERMEPLRSQCLSLNGSGYASIADASQTGLNMGLSDFMIEERIKTSFVNGHQYIFSKYVVIDDAGYALYLHSVDDELVFAIEDGVIEAYSETIDSTPKLNNGKWRSIALVADRSSVTGLKSFIDGAEAAYDIQQDPTSVGNLDNSAALSLGTLEGYAPTFVGLIDEVRIWNFGVDGLPTDYAAYITWRHANPFAPTSEYNGGSWNTYVTNNLSAYYKFNGNYRDETTNSNDLTAGGSGNAFLWYGIDRATERVDTGGPGYTCDMTNIFCDRTDIYVDSTTTSPTQRTKPTDSATQRTKPTDTWTQRTKPT